MVEPSIEYGPSSLIGPLNMDGSGIIAGMKIGANLAGMMQNYQHSLASPTISSVLGTRDAVASIFPGHPSFLFARAKGIAIGGAGWEHAIAVNQVGRRFYNERAIADISSDAKYPPGSDGTRNPFVPLDWRNTSPAQVKAQYTRSAAVDAALAMNEGSRPPDYASGPVWAIFDSAAVQRGGWQIRYPYIADPPDGYFHKADTLAELAKKVMGHPYQKMPLKYLEETVARYNALADKGVDEDFEKPVLHRIDTPPFYAASASDPCAQFLRRSSDQREGPGPRHPRRSHTRPLRRRRGKWRRLAAWHRQSLGPWLHRRDECGPGAIGLRFDVSRIALRPWRQRN